MGWPNKLKKEGRIADDRSKEDSGSAHYSKMARYYDAVYSRGVNYPAQARFLQRILAKHMSRKPESVLDIACGTGNYTFVFAKQGYKATGIDISDEMLRIAREKTGGKTNPRFIKMDMRNIELESKYDVATVLFGGFGYLVGNTELSRFFTGVGKHLNRGGLLAFEFWQNSAVLPAAARQLGQKSWDRAEDDDRLIVRLNLSKYDSHTNTLNIKFDFYVLDMERKKLLDTFSETHRVKTYSISQMKELLEQNRFKALAFYDGDLGKTGDDELALASFSTFRVLAIAKTL